MRFRRLEQRAPCCATAAASALALCLAAALAACGHTGAARTRAALGPAGGPAGAAPPTARPGGPTAPAAAPAPAPAPGAPPRAAPAADWVDSTLRALPLRRKVAQLVFAWTSGAYLAEGSPEYETLKHWVADDGVGGVIVSIGPPYELAARLNQLQRLAAVPLLVASDMEHGPGQRLNGAVVLPYGLEVGGGTDFPPAMGIGATGDPRYAFEMGRITAIEARAVGVQMDLAPVADVNNNPDNPIINTRSYGGDPQRVARMVAAHVRGLREDGMLATAKHFPGHGDVGIDSHLALPIITAGRARVDSVELVPFRAAIAAGVDAVMSAHIAFPALTGDTTPATLSPRLLQGLLGRDLGFHGLVVTDAIDMGALVRRYGGDRIPVLALRAGADILLQPPDVGAAIDAVVGAVERGELTEARIDSSVAKILRAKQRLGLPRGAVVDLDRIAARVGTPDHQALAARAAAASITAARDAGRLLPVTAARHPLSIVYTDDPDPFAGRAFQRAIAARFPTTTTVSLDAGASAARLDSLRVAAAAADVVFVSAFVRVIARKGDLAVPEGLAALIADIAARRPTVVTAFGNPYIIRQFPRVGTYVLAWGQTAVVQAAAARAITGQAPITGRLPISIPPLLRIGDGIDVPAAAAAATGGTR